MTGTSIVVTKIGLFILRVEINENSLYGTGENVCIFK